MKPKHLAALGFDKSSPAFPLLQRLAGQALARGESEEALRAVLTRLAKEPEAFADNSHWSAAARLHMEALAARANYVEHDSPVRYVRYGDGIEAGAIQQMENACRLPITRAAALMPDAHQGYGLPIGGVLAVENAVIPYAVGMDIACRMKLTVLDMPPQVLSNPAEAERLRNALERETRFGVGASFRKRHDHAVMDADWTVSPVTRRWKDRAWAQLGTSGSGNHFVEFGELTLESPARLWTRADGAGAPGKTNGDLPAGTYLALLSHSGSRGTGGEVAQHYSRLAMRQRPELPKELQTLAWFALDSAEGREYWAAMELMGRYAAANHELIHRMILKNLGAAAIGDVENHHNFAWRETHVIDGTPREVVVHRKGATPAAAGALGVIPGSMAAPGFVVRGRGTAESLNSASHGAGRAMSRTKANETFTRAGLTALLEERGVRLLSAGLDECPLAYKDIHAVMAAQKDLVDVLAVFMPRLVKMAPAGERAED